MNTCDEDMTLQRGLTAQAVLKTEQFSREYKSSLRDVSHTEVVRQSTSLRKPSKASIGVLLHRSVFAFYA